MKETILKTQTIYTGRVFDFALLDVELPDKTRAKRELIQHPPAVAMVAMDAEDHLLMVRQYRIAADRITLEIPAGAIEPDEDILEGAARELQEETGFRPGKLEHLGGFYPAPSYNTEYIHLFLATDLTEARLEMDDDEFIEVERVTLTDALRMIDKGTICDAKSVAGLLRVARHLGKD